MTDKPESLTDDEILTSSDGVPATEPSHDADGVDGHDADGVDGDSTDGTDGGDADGTDGDSTDGTDGNSHDADGVDA